jgi:hypothetical protein
MRRKSHVRFCSGSRVVARPADHNQLTGLISARVRRCSPTGVWSRGPGDLPAAAQQLTLAVGRPAMRSGRELIAIG